jgi:hypothetical protein
MEVSTEIRERDAVRIGGWYGTAKRLEVSVGDNSTGYSWQTFDVAAGDSSSLATGATAIQKVMYK